MAVRRVSALVAAFAVVAVSTACNPMAQRNSGPIPGAGARFTKDLGTTLRTSGFNPDDEVGKARSDYAASRLPGVTVEQDTTSFDPQKFAAQAASGNVPDLIQTDRSVVATLADKSLIVPLDDCFRLYGVTPDRQYYPSTIRDVTYNNAVYAIPQFFQPSALIADKTVLARAGVSVDQLDTSKPDALVALGQRLSASKGGKPAVIGFDPDVPGSAFLWFTVFGGRTNDDTGRPALDDPGNAAALAWLKQLMDAQGGYPQIKSFKDSMDTFGDNNQYVRNEVGVQTWAQWYLNVLAGTKDAVSVAAAPIKTLEGKPIAMASGTAFAVTAAGRNRSAACAWAINATSEAAWLAAGQARADKVEADGGINTGLFTGSPVADQAIRKKFVRPSGNADFDQMINTYYEILPGNVTRGASAVGQQIDADLSNAVAVTLTGEKTPEQALADAQASSLRAWDQSKAGRR